MASPHEKKEFESWQRALSESRLEPEQMAVLEDMVEDWPLASSSMCPSNRSGSMRNPWRRNDGAFSRCRRELESG